MVHNIYNRLYEKGLLSDESLQKLDNRSRIALFSVHRELNILLYLGVLLFTGGMATLIYKNIDTIGHQVVLALIAIVCAGCFYYCFKHKLPFGRQRVASPNTGFDYVLLLGSLLLVTFVGYVQYKYNIFGSNYGLATFIPMVMLFYIAYDFDHLGILSMAIANLAVWMGVSVTPKTLLLIGEYNTPKLIYTYLLLGIILLAAAWLTGRLNIKKHFKFSYHNYGTHVTFVALLCGFFHYFENSISLIWVLAVFGLAYYIYSDAAKERSLYLAIITVLYSYIAFCGFTVKLFSLMNPAEAAIIELMILLFILSAIGLILLLVNIIRKFKDDRIR